MRHTAVLDPALSVRIVGARPLHYDRPGAPDDDRADHVRAASGLALHQGRLVIVQDDASFLAIVARDGVSAIKLPRGLDGRRRFEVALGNKLDKLDLESCVAIEDELWAFGSGSLPIRDNICVVQHGVVRVRDATPFYDRLREALDCRINLEGVARVRDELWLFHRGNTGATDHGPAILTIALPAMRAWLAAEAALPPVVDVRHYDLGAIDGARLGFTDAFADGDRVLYLAAAELSANAVDDGRVAGSQVGVIDSRGVRAAVLVSPTGDPVKAEGIALDPAREDHAWIALDPDDPEVPAVLLDVELAGPWRR